MKKTYILSCALALASTSFAQTITNSGMETWRSNPSGTETISAPDGWFGMDSLLIGVGQSFLMTTDWHPQVFQSTTVKNSGTSSAKLISVHQDTLDFFSGILTNAQPGINLAVIIAGGDPSSALTFSGGTPTTLRITSVSAYVNYAPGKDIVTGLPGSDTGTLMVQAVSIFGGAEVVVGTGIAEIRPTASSFMQITANVDYADTSTPVSLVRIIFIGGGTKDALDSSILYVDDVTMTGVPQTSGITVADKGNVPVKVYPNPTRGLLYFSSTPGSELSCSIVSNTGTVITTIQLNGTNTVDLSYLPSGLYFYTIADAGGNKIQHGKVMID